ncbi:MAG: porin [Pseudomonadota bacterium]
MSVSPTSRRASRGFQLGVSYARDGLQDSNAQINLDGVVLANIFDVGVNYVNSFGDIDLAVNGGYGVAFGDGGENPQVWNAGINVGYAGVTVGGSFAEQNNSRGGPLPAGSATTATDFEDGIAYDAGISYETGPWGFSFTYFHGENVNDQQVVSNSDEEVDMFLLGASYALAKGVKLNAFGAYLDFSEEVGDAGGSGDDVDGFVIGTGIKLSF